MRNPVGTQSSDLKGMPAARAAGGRIRQGALISVITYADTWGRTCAGESAGWRKGKEAFHGGSGKKRHFVASGTTENRK